MDNVIVLNLRGCVSPQRYHNAGIACKQTTVVTTAPEKTVTSHPHTSRAGFIRLFIFAPHVRNVVMFNLKKP